MSEYKVTIQGESPLLMNRFTEETAAQISAGTTVAISAPHRGTPREQAEPKLYLSADKVPMIPGPNVFRGIIDAGVFHKVGRKALTNAKSSLIPAGMQLVELECKLSNPFGSKLVWEVDSRSVVTQATGGRRMCHRPRFDAWRLDFTIKVDDKMFDERITRLLVDDMGSKIGLGDFRPSRKGPFGRFLITSWERVAIKVPSAKVA